MPLRKDTKPKVNVTVSIEYELYQQAKNANLPLSKLLTQAIITELKKEKNEITEIKKEKNEITKTTNELIH
jgi:post-segregation antitoxin (ccd killing protein)